MEKLKDVQEEKRRSLVDTIISLQSHNLPLAAGAPQRLREHPGGLCAWVDSVRDGCRS